MSEEDLFTINLSFPRSPKATRTKNAYKEKIRSWLVEEKKSMPFEKMTSSKSQISLESRDFLLLIDFSKKITLVLGTRKPIQNLEKLNEISNKLFSYLNTIMPEEVKEVQVNTDIMITKRGETDFAKKVIGDIRIAKIGEIMKSPWNPLAVVFEWKTGMRHNLSMVGKFQSEVNLFLSSTFKWENNLPLDAIVIEKGEFLKFEEMINKITKEEL